MVGSDSSSSAGGFRSEEKNRNEPAEDRRNEWLPLPSAGGRNEAGGTTESEQQDCSVNWELLNGADVRTNGFADVDRVETNGELPDDATLSSSESDSKKDDHWKSLERCISACTKGFVIGSGLRGGLALVSVLSRLKRRNSR